MADVPKIARDARLVVPRLRLTGKVVMVFGAAAACLGVLPPTHANATTASQPTVVTVAKPSPQPGPGPLVLAPHGQTGLLAQHRSHASHASHYSGAGSGASTPRAATRAPATPKADSTESGNATPKADNTKGGNATPKDASGAKSTENMSTTPPSVASATITSAPDLADIEIDGKYAGSTRSALRLSPGTHEIVVKRSGYAPWTRTIDVSAGSEVTVHADLQPTKKAPPAKKTTPSRK
jgi:hypothetical protein